MTTTLPSPTTPSPPVALRVARALALVLAGAAAVAAVRSASAIGLPLLAGYLMAAGAAGAYLGYTTLHDRVVDETVATGTPASAMPPAAADPAQPPPAVDVEEARGRATVVIWCRAFSALFGAAELRAA